MGRVEGKVALVTGAASRPGLGSSTAERLAAEGAHVHASDLDAAGAELVAAAIRHNGGAATAHAHDVTSEADWDRVFAAILAAHGRLDILVNNAGIAVLKPLEQLTPADWARQLDVNLTSVYHGTRRAVAAMRAAGGGAIVSLSSVAGDVGVVACSAYAASKAGLVAFSRTVAAETAQDNIRVNTVHPGLIATNMVGASVLDNPEEYARLTATIPMRRLGDPADIAAAILYLVSDEARYVTGTSLTVDAGLTAI